MNSVYVIRHGMTDANKNRCFCGISDLHITDEGVLELKEKKAKVNYPDVSGMDIYCSRLVRTKETAEILFPGKNPVPVEGFNEMNFGDFELRGVAGDLESDPDFQVWIKDHDDDNICPNGESNNAMKARVVAAFKEVAEKGRNAVIVCHGGPIVAIFQHLVPDSGLRYPDIQPRNGEGYCFEFEDGKFAGWSKLTEE